MGGSFADVEEPQSIYDGVLVRGPTAGPLVLCFWTGSQRVSRSPAPGAVRLPAFIGGVSSTALTTLGASGFTTTVVVIGFEGIVWSLTISTFVVGAVVGIVAGVVVVVPLLVWPLPFSPCRAIEVSPSTPRSPGTGWRMLSWSGGICCLDRWRSDNRGSRRCGSSGHSPLWVDHRCMNSRSSTVFILVHSAGFSGFDAELYQLCF